MLLSGLKIHFNVIKILQKITDSDAGAFLEVNVEYPIKLHETHNDLGNIFTRKNENWKAGKLLFNLNDKKEYVVHMKTEEEAQIHKLALQKLYRVIKFNLEALLKTYIDINIEVRKMPKMTLKKILSS